VNTKHFYCSDIALLRAMGESSTDQTFCGKFLLTKIV